MLDDQSVAEAECRIDAVQHRPAGAGERVVRVPMRAALRIVGGNRAGLDAQILAALAEHRPHRAYALAVERREHRVREPRLRVIAGGHRRWIALRECGVRSEEHTSELQSL